MSCIKLGKCGEMDLVVCDGWEHIGKEELDELLTVWRAPALRKLGDDGVGGCEYDTVSFHSSAGEVFGVGEWGTGGIEYGLNTEAFIDGIDGREDQADIGGNTGHDKIALAGSDDRVSEVRVGPGVDDAGALNAGGEGIGEDAAQLGDQGALDAVFL